MLKPDIHSGYAKSTYLIFLLFFVQGFIFSQTILFNGITKDEQTQKPIRDVNIKVYGTTRGTSTDHAGNVSFNTISFGPSGGNSPVFPVFSVGTP